jgi:hypothetical protein
MKVMIRTITVFALAGASLLAQEGLRGHWSGAVETPNQALNMEVDLDQKAGAWVGSVSIPAQHAVGIPLDSISFQNGKCVFHIKGVPGDPAFNGSISADGKTLSGEFTQGAGSFPFKFKRNGDPKVEEAKKSPAVAKPFVGTWEGALDAGGQTLRLILKLANEGASSTGTLISVDQGAAEIPVSGIEQSGDKLMLRVQMVGGTYDASINKEGTELDGTWTQGTPLPLKLKKTVR